METKIKPIDNWTDELEVSLNKSDLGTYIQKVEKDLSAEIAVDGFRKGKAPKELMQQKLDQTKVRELALARALESSLATAIAEQKLDVRKVTDLKMEENSAQALRYSVRLHIFPQVTLPKLTSVTVEQKDISVNEKEIEDTLESVRNSRAVFHDKTGAAAQGDRVEVDFQVSINGKPLEGGDSKNHPLIIGGRNFIPGFEDKLVGMHSNEEKEFTITAPDDYFQKELVGKKLDFKVKVHKIQSVELPTLNNAFIQTLGAFKDLNQLRGNIREGLYEEKKDKEQQRMRLEILDGLIKQINIKLPPAMVQEQLDIMVTNFDADLHRRGLELNMYLAHLGKTLDDLKKDWIAEAERQVKISLIIRKVAKDQKIAISADEVEQTASTMVQSLIARGEMNPSEMDIEALKTSVRDRLVNEKTLEYIEKICVK